jgi:hypothetical protein
MFHYMIIMINIFTYVCDLVSKILLLKLDIGEQLLVLVEVTLYQKTFLLKMKM